MRPSGRLARCGFVFLSLVLIAGPALADPWFVLGRKGIRGSGDVIEEVREVEGFDRIRLRCSADLRITVGGERAVTVITDDNLQEFVVCEVGRRGQLEIDIEESYRSRHGVLIEISVPKLVGFELDGSGDVYIDDLKAERFDLDLDGSGDIHIRGSADEFGIIIDGSGDVEIEDLNARIVDVRSRGSGDLELRGRADDVELSLHGSGDVRADRLEANRVDVSVHGTGDARVFAIESFDGRIRGSGDIDVYGEARDFNRSVSGSGDINRH